MDSSSSGQILASWGIRKRPYRVAALTFFITAFTIFVISFSIIYLFEQSTNPILLVIPVLLFLPLIPTFRDFWSAMGIYKKNFEVYLTENGVYLRNLDKNNDYKFLDWLSIRQYDIQSFSSTASLIPKPTRFVLRSLDEAESLTLDAFKDEADILRTQLNSRDIPFGFVKNE